MAMNSSRRNELLLAKDLQQLVDENDGITQRTGGLVHVFSSSSSDESESSTDNYNPYELQGSMQGPPGSPYSEGIFLLYIQIPDDYPFQAPMIQFQTPIWHPNIGPHDGIVYLDALTDGNWTPAWKLNTLLMAVFSILSDPLADDHNAAINKEAAKLYRLNPYQYRHKAQAQTRIHACPQITERQQYAMIESLGEMGFVNTEVTKRVLESKEEAALELLMTVGATDPPPISYETQTMMTTQSTGEENDKDTEVEACQDLEGQDAAPFLSHVPTTPTAGREEDDKYEYEYNDSEEDDDEDNDNICGMEEETGDDAGARPTTTTTPAILRVDDDDQEEYEENQQQHLEKKNGEKQDHQDNDSSSTSTSVGGESFEEEYYLIGGCSSSEDGTNSEGQSSASYSFVLVDQMRVSRNGENGGGGDGADGEGARPRQGGRRAPARTKLADDMAAMSRMTRYARQKSKEENKTGEAAVPEDGGGENQ